MIISFTVLLTESDIKFNFSKTRESQIEMHVIGVLTPHMFYK